MKKSSPQQRAILITGCSSGIGLCVANALKQRGYRVFATARSAKDVSRLRASGLESLLLDLDNSDSINQAVVQILEKSDGKLYALFNNGAYGQPGAVEDLSRQTIRSQFETNVFGPMELTNLVLPTMRQQKTGRIIQNSSVLGFAAMPYRGAYNASKFAIEGFSDTLRLELQGSGVFVSLIQPGPIESCFRANGLVAFLKNIDYSNSLHATHYESVLERLKKGAKTTRFTLGPEHVLRRVIHALESDKPTFLPH